MEFITQAVAIDDEGKEIVGLDINNKPINAKTIGVTIYH